MKHIHFDNNKNWGWVILLILSLFFIVSGTFEFFEFENPKINKRISAVGFLFQIIYFSKMFWYKNYVQWNEKGITIKLNIIVSTTLSFKDITAYHIQDHKLVICRKGGATSTFNIDDIVKDDIEKLQQIIAHHIATHQN